MLLSGEPTIADRLRSLGAGGAIYAARRFARVLVPSEATLGWKALDALDLLGEQGLAAIAATREELPHAAHALDYATEWISFRLGRDPAPQHLPFIHMLDQQIQRSDRRGNLVISWTPFDSPVHGSLRVEIFGGGDRIVIARPAGAAVATTRRTLMGAMAMDALLEAMRWSAIWRERALRETGLPDEPRPALEVQVALGDPFIRRISMWNGEWRHGPSFRLADLLDRLTAAVNPESIVPPRR